MSEIQMVGVMYVGKKPSAVDSIARSGVTWDGFGDVKEVPEEGAVQLCHYPDQWWPKQDKTPTRAEVDALVTQFAKGDKSVLKPIVIEASAETGKRVAKDPGPAAKDYHKMSMAQLRKVAMDEHGHKFKVGMSALKAADELLLLDEQAIAQGR